MVDIKKATKSLDFSTKSPHFSQLVRKSVLGVLVEILALSPLIQH